MNVKEGWLLRRSTHMKTWRSRYFVLKADGSFLSYHQATGLNEQKPENDFTINDCQIISSEKPKANSFIIRGLQWSSIVERTFVAKSGEERTEWISTIYSIRNLLKDNPLLLRQPIIQQISSTTTTTTTSTSNYSMMEMDDNCSNDLSINRNNCTSSIRRSCRNSFKIDGFGKKQKQTKQFQKRVSIHDFHLIKVLGRGSFGKVVLSEHKSTNNIYAIKILKKQLILAKDEVSHILTENKVLKSTSHPFLTSLKYAFQTMDHLCFVMEFATGGELFFHLQRDKRFNEERVCFYTGEITLALGYLHDNDIVYRDIKLENLLLDQFGHIKITDFGLCKEIDYNSATKTFCGTPEYLAPEVLEDTRYNRAVDWWSLGVVTFEMLTGRLPFNSRDTQKLFEMILLEAPSFPTDVPLSKEAFHLLCGLLIKNPIKRLGGGIHDYKELLVHPFFANINWRNLYDRKIEPPFKPEIASTTDTRYFDNEFTKQAVCLTPPNTNELDYFHKRDYAFSNFSYNPSINSIHSYDEDSSSVDHQLINVDDGKLLSTLNSLRSNQLLINGMNESLNDLSSFHMVSQDLMNIVFSKSFDNKQVCDEEMLNKNSSIPIAFTATATTAFANNHLEEMSSHPTSSTSSNGGSNKVKKPFPNLQKLLKLPLFKKSNNLVNTTNNKNENFDNKNVSSLSSLLDDPHLFQLQATLNEQRYKKNLYDIFSKAEDVKSRKDLHQLNPSINHTDNSHNNNNNNNNNNKFIQFHNKPILSQNHLFLSDTDNFIQQTTNSNLTFHHRPNQEDDILMDNLKQANNSTISQLDPHEITTFDDSNICTNPSLLPSVNMKQRIGIIILYSTSQLIILIQLRTYKILIIICDSIALFGKAVDIYSQKL
ncbi:hypothetical protein SNEBB_000285 [Seison nebaliae]|nr:hypothetical protein SNEBB_000285 [Seison nebaliae]